MRSAGHRRGAQTKGEAPRRACAHEARHQPKGGDKGGVGERGVRGQTSSTKPIRAKEGAMGHLSAFAGGGPPSEDRALHQSAGQGARLLNDLVATVKEQ